MNFWILSPNVTANSNEESKWKDLIQKKHLAFIGWGEGDKFGDMFIEQIKIGDVILIAQGANRQKRVFLSGVVSSDSRNNHIEGAPRATLYRQLKNVVSKEQLEAIGLDFNGCAFGDSDQIPALYRLKPHENSNDKHVADQLYNKIKEMAKRNELNDLISLLNMKKQIILQGPPGTGKTFTAKQIAQELLKPKTITIADIDRLVREGTIISSATKYTQYTITSITDKAVNVRLDNSTSIYPATKTKIVAAYESKLWLGGQVGGNDPYEAAVAMYVYENILPNDQFRIIQFHPAYSYEDFVRGITVKPNGNLVEYVTEDKILAKFATAAQKNYLDSKKDITALSRQTWLMQMFEDFKDHIENILNDDEKPQDKYHISTSVYIYDIDEGAFRYTGDNWATKSHRILFADIIKLYLADVTSRQGVKQQRDVSGLARQHATYYFNLLKKFREFIGEKPFDSGDIVKVEERPYILIIDEMNRANLPAVLGELIYALEYRGERVEGMYEYEEDGGLIIPPNLYIIGTMNTADRSVGHIDYAIRRRFAFVDVLPSPAPIKDIARPLFKAVSELFIENFDTLKWPEPKPKRSDFLAADFRPEDVWIGHSYFITKEEGDAGKKELELKLKYEIKPILIEYLKDGILLDAAAPVIENLSVNVLAT